MAWFRAQNRNTWLQTTANILNRQSLWIVEYPFHGSTDTCMETRKRSKVREFPLQQKSHTRKLSCWDFAYRQGASKHLVRVGLTRCCSATIWLQFQSSFSRAASKGCLLPIAPSNYQRLPLCCEEVSANPIERCNFHESICFHARNWSQFLISDCAKQAKHSNESFFTSFSLLWSKVKWHMQASPNINYCIKQKSLEPALDGARRSEIAGFRAHASIL